MADHNGGDTVIQMTAEEHSHEALAKRVVIELLNLAATGFGSPSLLEGTQGNAMMVALADTTTGSPIAIKNPKSLGNGALSTTSTAIYTVPASTKTWVTKIRMRNTGASTRVISLSFQESSSGTARAIWPDTTLLTGESAEFLADEGPMGMSAGNALYASQDSGTDVAYLITGEELT